jgi:hypothetical protein
MEKSHFLDKLLSLPFEDLFQFLKFNSFKDNEIVIDELIKKANSYKEVVKRSLKGLEKEYAKSKEQPTTNKKKVR